MLLKTFFLLAFLYPFMIHAQTADEIVKKYVDFIGGKTGKLKHIILKIKPLN